MKNQIRYSQEVKERAVRMVFEHEKEYSSQWAAISSIAPKIGCTLETLRTWIRQVERDQGIRPGMTSAERDRMKELELREPKLAPCQRNHTQSSCFFRPSGARPPAEVMVAFIDEHKTDYGVEPICRTLQIASSNTCERKHRQMNPDQCSPRVKRDIMLREEIKRVWEEFLSLRS